MPDMKTLLEKKSTYITRQFGDLKLYIRNKFDEKDNMNFLVNLESELLKRFIEIEAILITLFVAVVIILILLIFKG